MASMSLPSIHEMFPDHLMKSDFGRPQTNSKSSDYRSLVPSPAPSICSTPSCHCSSASSSTTTERSTSFHRRLAFSAAQTKSAEPPSRKNAHSGPYSERGMLFKNDHRPDSSSKAVTDLSFHPGSSTPSHLNSHYPDSRSRIIPPFDVDSSRDRDHPDHNPYPQEPAYSNRSLLSSDRAHPQFSNRSYPCDTNGGNSWKPDYEDDDCPVGKSTTSIDGVLLVNNMDALGRKHVCPTCFKRFNRPSSLRIHLNTHTGATPFKCPWPKCGREFNVNSNMRRHYRNHLGTPRGQGHLPPPHGANELRPLAPATTHPGLVAEMDEEETRAFSSRFHARRSSTQDMGHIDSREGRYAGWNGASSRGSLSASPSISQTSSLPSRTSSPTGTESHSPERASQPRYNPSKPYSATLSDARVRTTLRPAFM